MTCRRSVIGEADVGMLRGRRFAMGLVAALLLFPVVWALGNAATQPVEIAGTSIDLAKIGALSTAGGEAFPERGEDIAGLVAQFKPAEKIDLFGGSYWIYAELKQVSPISEWVLDPNNTLIDRVEARVYGSDGSIQQVLTGYRNDHQYMLHYGKSIRLKQNHDYRVLIKFSSPYFASLPRFEVLPEAAYRDRVLREILLIVGCLGALASLALFNLMLFVATRDKSALYYALYLIAFGTGWAFVFHIPAELFGLRNLSLHYVPFFLTPVASALFCLDFLKLRENFPRLARLCVAAIVVSLAAMPVCFLAQKYCHILATIIIGTWLPLAIFCAIAAWRKGYRPARFFAIAFVALLIPGALIIPANLGWIDDVVQNSELFTLVGGTIDAILLAFALADKIKLLGQEKDSYLMRLNHALKLAHTDSMTGIGNRHAFDQLFDQELKLSFMEADENQPMLILVDLDGLKLINDKYGHAHGDELLRAFARALQEWKIDHVASFRLGGDEFAIVGRKDQEAMLREKLDTIDRSLSNQGFPESGVSYGIAFASESNSAAEMFNSADRRMYDNKMLKRTGRHQIARPI